jgi:hypothetical protein
LNPTSDTRPAADAVVILPDEHMVVFEQIVKVAKPPVLGHGSNEQLGMEV